MPAKFIKTIAGSIRKLNPDQVKIMSRRPVRIGLTATTEAGYTAMIRFLGGTEGVYRSDHAGAPRPFDLELFGSDMPRPVSAFTFHADDPGRTADGIVARCDEDLLIPLARMFPVFRPLVADRFVNKVSQENALFSLATALPDMIPSFLSLPWIIGEFASDTAFLTANQLKLAFMLAAANGREVGYGEQKREVASVIAGAFGWRALARQLIAKVPFGGGLLPKAAIAYAGTWVVGRSLDKLYRTGNLLSLGERKSVHQDGLEIGRNISRKLLAGLKYKG